MGTRNLNCILYEGKLKVAKYCQWDGYPSGQGSTIISYIQDIMNKDNLINSIKKIKKPSKAWWEKTFAKLGHDLSKSEFVPYNISIKLYSKYPHLSRDMGGKIFEYIENNKPTYILNDKDFGKDSLFCEYAYVINLDNDTLEFYKGFQKELPEKSIFCDPKKDKPNKSGYYPVKKALVLSFEQIKNTPKKEIILMMEES